jgi:zinc transport system permease protein
MTNVLELLTFDFFTSALLVIVITAVISGIAGTYMVARRSVFMSGGITHASFGGIGIAYFLGWPPFLGAAIFAVITAVGIELSTQKMKIREDSTIAILWSLGMAIGIIFIFLTPGYTPNLMSFLFGDILTVQSSDIYWLVAVAIALLSGIAFFFRPVLYTTYDPEFASISGINSSLVRIISSVLSAISIVMAIKVMGIILVLSLFTIPQAIAGLFVKDYKRIMVVSVLISALGGILGLWVAFAADLPSGAAIIVTLVTLFVLIRIIKTSVQSRLA